MSRRTSAVLFLLALLTGAARPASAAEPAASAPRTPWIAEAPEGLPLSLALVFHRVGESLRLPGGMVVARFDAPDVVIARVTPDGKAVLACVDSEKAARRILESADPKVLTPVAKEK